MVSCQLPFDKVCCCKLIFTYYYLVSWNTIEIPPIRQLLKCFLYSHLLNCLRCCYKIKLMRVVTAFRSFTVFLRVFFSSRFDNSSSCCYTATLGQHECSIRIAPERWFLRLSMATSSLTSVQRSSLSLCAGFALAELNAYGYKEIFQSFFPPCACSACPSWSARLCSFLFYGAQLVNWPLNIAHWLNCILVLNQKWIRNWTVWMTDLGWAKWPRGQITHYEINQSKRVTEFAFYILAVLEPPWHVHLGR